MVAAGWSVGGFQLLINECPVDWGFGGVGSAVERSHRQNFAVRTKIQREAAREYFWADKQLQ
jgi:hypothetical protein